MENKKRIKRLKIIERFADVFLSITLSINVALVVFGPYPIKAISSGDFGDVLGEDYNDELNSIAAKLYEAFPHVDFKVLNKNLNWYLRKWWELSFSFQLQVFKQT